MCMFERGGFGEHWSVPGCTCVWASLCLEVWYYVYIHYFLCLHRLSLMGHLKGLSIKQRINKRHERGPTCNVHRLTVAVVGEAALPLGEPPDAPAVDLARQMVGRQADAVPLLLPVDQHHRTPAAAVGLRLARLVDASLAKACQTWNASVVQVK